MNQALTPIAPAVLARLREALSAVLDVAAVSAHDKLLALRSVGDTVAAQPTDIDAAFERVKLRSLGVENEIRTLEGGGLTDAEFAAKLGLGSRETVRSYRERGRIFAWHKDIRNLRYPAWQLHEGGLLPGLGDVLAILGKRSLTSLAIADYFLSESDDLGGLRPLDLLRGKRVGEVIEHASRYGDIGT